MKKIFKIKDFSKVDFTAADITMQVAVATMAKDSYASADYNHAIAIARCGQQAVKLDLSSFTVIKLCDFLNKSYEKEYSRLNVIDRKRFQTAA